MWQKIKFDIRCDLNALIVLSTWSAWVFTPQVHIMTSSNGNIFCVTGPLCGEFTGHKGQWRGALMFSLICAWINGWVNNCEAGDLRRHRAHYVLLKIALFDSLPKDVEVNSRKIIVKWGRFRFFVNVRSCDGHQFCCFFSIYVMI